jgi:hypothetical protein
MKLKMDESMSGKVEQIKMMLDSIKSMSPEAYKALAPDILSHIDVIEANVEKADPKAEAMEDPKEEATETPDEEDMEDEGSISKLAKMSKLLARMKGKSLPPHVMSDHGY